MKRKKFVFFLFLICMMAMGAGWGSAQIAPVGRYLTFNGLDQRFMIPDHSDLDIGKGESFTLSVRIRNLSDTARFRILSKGNTFIPGSLYELISLPAATGPGIALNLRNAENTQLGASNLHTPLTGYWFHVAWVYSALDKSSKVYIDGVLVSQVNHTSIGKVVVDNDYSLTAGCGWTDADEPEPCEYWPGQMDELRIWKRALTGSDIATDSRLAKAAPEGLVAAYDFENLIGNNVVDVSGRGHNGQLYGYGIRVVKCTLPVGMGEMNERLVSFRLNPGIDPETVSSITIDLTGTNPLSDVTRLKVYHNGKAERLDLNTARLFGTIIPTGTKNIIRGNLQLDPGDNYFWVTADISQTAREGNQIRASVLSYESTDRNTHAVPQVDGSRMVLIAHKLLFSSGDGGSRNYRIPAIVTARDGSLVTATDKRWESPHDLPAHIDVVIRRSTDNGQTWSPALSIAGIGTNSGFGDPALVVNRKTGEIICLFAADKGFFNSTSSAPIRIYQSKSRDNGISWSTPTDITPQIYGAQCLNPATATWQGAFVTSGAATQLRSGRIVAVMPVRENANRVVSSFMLYSDDHARTWKAAPGRASANGSEGKIVELENGRLLMSIRNAGNRIFTVSKDQGMSWGTPFPKATISDPACNGDLIRYTSVSEGYNRNRLLHSIPLANSRKNVSVLLSYDEGETWPVRKTICPGLSAYSSLCILKDGSIGIYYEAGEYETYQMYFARFSLEWLTDGADWWSDRWRTILDTDPVTEVSSGLSVYPNPASGTVNLAGPLEVGATLGLYNAGGELVKNIRVENFAETIQISLEGLPSGLYLIKSGREIIKFMVSN